MGEQAFVYRAAGICGYGCNPDSPLGPYADDFARWGQKRQLNAIIPSGGHTMRRSFPGLSEAQVLRNRIEPQLVTGLAWTPEWFLDDDVEGDAYTTYDNIKNFARRVEEVRARSWYGTVPRQFEITIWCEATRALKVAILARHFFGFPPAQGEPAIRIMTGSWELADPIRELRGTMQTYAAMRAPVFNDIQRRRCIAAAELR